ncbi:MAG TPA: reductive dehalogenase domain-containing protein [Anaerolineales bacterium]
MADSKVSRRDFIKGLGAAGAVASVAAVFTEASAAAKAPSAYAGWENRRGTEYFDRSRFEVAKPESYQVVGTLKRRDTRVYDSRARLGGHQRGEDAVTKYDAGDPFWADYYAKNPADGDGLPQPDTDRMLRDEWYPPQQAIVEAGAERRTEFATTGEGFLAAAWSIAYQDFSYPRPSSPPEEADWEEVSTVRGEFKSPELASKFIKGIAANFGATLCRITEAQPAWFYANGLRGVEEDVAIGDEFEIRPWWKYAIVVTRPMEFDALGADPNFGNSYSGYNPSTYVATHVARSIKALGYPSRVEAPMAGYEMFVVPFAVDAGFGELARTCNCVSPDMGGNFRQSVVLTNLPLAMDKPINAGVADFCKKCKICSEYCWTGSISMDDEPNWEEAGVLRWDVNGFTCSMGWNQVSGGDSYPENAPGGGLRGCRACISVCPWYRRTNWLHNSVRSFVANDPTGLADDFSLQFERAVYERRDPSLWLAPEMKGVHDEPDWLRTADFIKSFSDTPLGEA